MVHDGLSRAQIDVPPVKAWGEFRLLERVGHGGFGEVYYGVSDGGNTIADDHGRYRFASFNPGDYIVGAYTPDQPDGSPSSDVVVGFWKDTLDIDRATWIDLSTRNATDRCPYDIRLRPVSKDDDGPRYHVEGTLVSDLSTVSARNQEWELRPMDRRPDSPPAIPFDPARPVFSFDGVSPGKYRLLLGPPPPSYFSGPCFPFRRIDVNQEIVVAADVFGVQVSTQPVAWIKGQVEEVHTAQDAQGWSYPGHPSGVTLYIHSQCVGATIGDDGSFEFRDLDPGTADIDFKVLVEGSYTSQFVLNGESSADPVLHLQPGENDLKIVERFDSGQVDAIIDARSVDGLPERDQQGVWVGDDEHVLLLDDKGRAFRTNFTSPQGELKGYLPPGRYTAVAGMNEQLLWGWASMNWDDARVYKAVAALGTAFVVEPDMTTPLRLRDRTVEIQNMSAELGLPMNRR